MDRIVRVNMNTKEIEVTSNEKYKLLGGRALTSRIVYEEVDPTCDPLGEYNKLVIAPGLLAGTAVSSASRLSVGCKSPLTNGIKEANCGGTIGAALAKNDVKAIVLEELAGDDNCYVLEIDGESTSLTVRNELRYLGCYDTVSRLKEIYGRDICILCIGPAGERLMRAASIAATDPTGELKFAARGGVGAVMGSKGIKAVVVRDNRSRQVEYHAKDEFMDVARKINKELISDPKTGDTYKKYGTAGIVNAVNAIGALPTKNFRYGSFEFAERLSGEVMYDTIIKRGGCGKTGIPCMNGCVIQCSNVYPDSHGKKMVSTLQYETIALMGSNCGFDNLDSVARLNWQCNDLGLDTIEMGAVLGVAIDAGLAKFGDEERCMRLMEEIRENTILGRVLANGVEVTGRVLGTNRIPAAKGQAFPGYDPRALKGNGVTYAMSPMGADHTAGNAFGSRKEVNPLGRENQGELSNTLQKRIATLDSLGFCIFARGPLFKEPSSMAALVNNFLGVNLSVDDIWEIGITTLKIEREFNVKAGISPAQDKLPEFCYREPLAPTNSVFDLGVEEMEKAIV
ncbi:aldehyde ferredoxin oxidoreductase family protein [Thermoanaerobacterium sp. DL9XJH110]|uniref:aldehyde ferredoxin oxidoreductase family protein n=1 Tax=Thermoanaerobacterium sp. DL9XJH110 TaxID=3386643 RepID=UPI003BB65052